MTDTLPNVLRYPTNIEHLATDALVPYARNSRTHSPEQVAQIAASIREYGFTNPVLIDANNTLIAGHGRVMAAQHLGLPTVPAIRLAHLTDAQRRAYVIADNKLAENAGWDMATLAREVEDLQADGYDLGLLGFGDDELTALLGEYGQDAAKPGDGKTDDDFVPEAPPVPATVVGDVWVLGKHRVMCGDSTSVSCVDKLMAGDMADMVFTDPPYNVAVVGGTHDSRDKKNFGKGPKIINDSMSDEEFKKFLIGAFTAMFKVVKDGSAVYVSHADSEGINFRTAFKESGFMLKQCLIWAKQQFVFGRSDYHWQHEPILYGWKPGASHSFYGQRNQSTLWSIDRPMRSDKEHPTQKPVDLVEKALLNSSKIGDLLFEPFGGGGSTLIACEKNNRIARLMELDPKYVDVIVTRWQQFTGKTATLESTGQTFDQIKQQRLSIQ